MNKKKDRIFFPSVSKRGVVQELLTEFPFPLALTYKRLQEEMDREEPIAAAWQLRDAFECLLKFTASLALADCLHTQPRPEKAVQLVSLLLKDRGLAVGDWHTLLEESLRPLERFARDNRLNESCRCLPSLFSCFFTSKGSRTPLNRRIHGQHDSFTSWRNRVFGHGVFKQERQYYADQTMNWLGTLCEFYEALAPVLRGWSLVSTTSEGEEIVWQGAGDQPGWVRHQHDPIGEPRSMFMRAAEGKRLTMGPLLSVQECAVCRQPAAFFFDRNNYDRKKDQYRTHFLEYFRGHEEDRRNWEEVRKWAALLPPNFKWERSVYDPQEVVEGVRIVFRDFESEYLRPDYLVEAIWQQVEVQEKGYIHLVGPGGVGKSYLVRGLEQEGAEQGIPVLSYHVLPGSLTDYRTFVMELRDRAKEKLRFPSQEVKTRVESIVDLQQQMVEFLETLRRGNQLETMIVAIDGLDELADSTAEVAAITSLLPSPETLPKGCFILLTSREELQPRIREDVNRLQAFPSFHTINLSPNNPANREILRIYLKKELPESFATPECVERLLDRCGGIFLYAFHFCRALEAGAFRDVSGLPEGGQFYGAYLGRYREQMGEFLYERVYLPVLLLLAAARQPVKLGQLVRWGVPRERLQFALLNLKDFLRVHRRKGWQEGKPRLRVKATMNAQSYWGQNWRAVL